MKTCVSVSSKYKIIRKIDSGQSDVYLAERNDGIYQQQVVIKFISNNYKSSILKEQFLQEMQPSRFITSGSCADY